MNAGGPAYTDSLGRVWQAPPGFPGANQETLRTPVSGTADPALYQDYRWNPSSYTFSVAPGQYQVSLLFTENGPKAQYAGARVFNVTMQGVVVFANLDIFAAVGGNAALIKTATASAPNGTIKIGFVPVSGLMPKVSAIQIVPGSSTPADTIAPSVSITAPASGATVSGTISVTAAASDNVNVVGVQFQVDGTNLGAEDTTAPYARLLDTTTLSNGTHFLTAIARDAAGNQATSAAVGVIISNSAATASSPALRVLANNPRYFTDGSGKAIYLTGSHTWASLRDDSTTDPPPPLDYNLYLNFLQSHNHNFTRLWTRELPKFFWDNQTRFESPFPWPRTGPGNATDGKPKFDLSQFNQAYFDRLRERVIAARDRGIYVGVMLFDGFGLQYSRLPDDGYPYDGPNNINGVASGSGTASQTLSDSGVTAVQEAYVRKVIDTVNDLDNVIYEIADESGSYSTGWQYHFIDFIRSYEATKPKQHPVGMTFQWSGGTDSTLFASTAEWISPGGSAYGSVSDPPANNGSKVILNDTDHSYNWSVMKSNGQAAQRAWVWKNFLRGLQPLFMDPYLVVYPGRNSPSGTTPDPYWNPVRDAMGQTLIYARKVNLAAMTPQNSLSSTNYCLASAGSEYLVYQPSSNSSFTVNLAAGTYSYEWFDPSTGLGTITATGTITVGDGNQSFTAPFGGDAVLYLKHQ